MKKKKKVAVLVLLLAGCRSKESGTVVSDAAPAPSASVASSVGCTADGEDTRVMYKRGADLVEPYMILHNREKKQDDNRERDLRAGIACMDKVIAGDPKNWSAMWVRGKAFQALGLHPDAAAAFEQAYALQPDEEDVARELAMEDLELNQFGKATRVCQAIVDKHPTNAGLRANLALAYLLDGDSKKAKAEIVQARRLEPNDPVSMKVEQRIDDVIAVRRPQPTSLREIER